MFNTTHCPKPVYTFAFFQHLTQQQRFDLGKLWPPDSTTHPVTHALVTCNPWKTSASISIDYHVLLSLRYLEWYMMPKMIKLSWLFSLRSFITRPREIRIMINCLRLNGILSSGSVVKTCSVKMETTTRHKLQYGVRVYPAKCIQLILRILHTSFKQGCVLAWGE